jgi:hypothetical protein
MEQLAPDAREPPQLFVWLKSPVIPSPTFMVTTPVLLKITVWAALGAFTKTDPNCRDRGEKAPIDSATPVPLSATGGIGKGASLDTEMEPVRVPPAVGAKNTAIQQVVLGRSVAGQPLF